MAIAIVRSEANVLSLSKDTNNYFVYILRSNTDKLYIGQTNNLSERLEQHSANTNKSAKYTKDYRNFKLVYSESYLTRIEAMRREKQLKHWTRTKKEALIKGDLKLLKKL